MKKKPKYSLYERIEYMTGKKIVICAAEDKENIKKRFPFRTRIVVAAGQAPGGYRIADIEAMRYQASKLAEKPEYKLMMAMLIRERQQS